MKKSICVFMMLPGNAILPVAVEDASGKQRTGIGFRIVELNKSNQRNIN